MRPGELGKRLKPFVFFNTFHSAPEPGEPVLGRPRQSGIATLTFTKCSDSLDENAAGQERAQPRGDGYWMRAGNCVSAASVLSLRDIVCGGFG